MKVVTHAREHKGDIVLSPCKLVSEPRCSNQIREAEETVPKQQREWEGPKGE